MSEINYFTSDLEDDLNKALDEVLPYEPYVRTSLDIVLVDEAHLAASTRMQLVNGELDSENITNGMLRSARAEGLYEEYYPQVERSDDLDFGKYSLTNPWVLKKYGTLEAQNSLEVTLGSKYPYTASSAVAECVARSMTIKQAKNYLQAVMDFTQDIHDIHFISKDELLHNPLLQLGVRLAHLYGEAAPNFAENFSTYLKEKVICHENLIGEDGQVAEDMTLSLYKWVEARVDEYVKGGDFRLPQLHTDDEDFLNNDRFTIYGNDAPYFREIERRRLEVEEEVMS